MFDVYFIFIHQLISKVSRIYEFVKSKTQCTHNPTLLTNPPIISLTDAYRLTLNHSIHSTLVLDFFFSDFHAVYYYLSDSHRSPKLIWPRNIFQTQTQTVISHLSRVCSEKPQCKSCFRDNNMSKFLIGLQSSQIMLEFTGNKLWSVIVSCCNSF